MYSAGSHQPRHGNRCIVCRFQTVCNETLPVERRGAPKEEKRDRVRRGLEGFGGVRTGLAERTRKKSATKEEGNMGRESRAGLWCMYAGNSYMHTYMGICGTSKMESGGSGRYERGSAIAVNRPLFLSFRLPPSSRPSNNPLITPPPLFYRSITIDTVA